nr:MAG TPA: hypothetical protein [Caudoviricetes sp.]
MECESSAVLRIGFAKRIISWDYLESRVTIYNFVT